MLDQDVHMAEDLQTYGWLVGFANNIIDEEETALNKLKEMMSR